MPKILRHIAKTATPFCATLLLFGTIPVQAAGHPQCARPEEVAVMDISALQQELMVAALSCGGTARSEFNDFQLSWKTTLQNSDQKMQTAFQEILGKDGEKAYHTFKTRLATNAELQRISNVPAYCATAHYKVLALGALIKALENTGLSGQAKAAGLKHFAVAAEQPGFVWPITACETTAQTTPAAGAETTSAITGGTTGTSASGLHQK